MVQQLGYVANMRINHEPSGKHVVRNSLLDASSVRMTRVACCTLVYRASGSHSVVFRVRVSKFENNETFVLEENGAWASGTK